MAEIPILIFHNVRDDPGAKPEEGVLNPRTFERQMAHLRKNGYRTVTIDELLRHRTGALSLPQRCVALTFDDASADHWQHVFPILQRYDVRATFFVPTVRPGSGPPRGADDQTSASDTMRWSELEQVAASGLVEVEAHSHLHSRHVVGARILSFRRPSRDLPFADWGRPIYQDAPALTRPRFEPDPGEALEVRSWIDTHGGRDFFDREDWQDQLHRAIDGYRASAAEGGVYETPESFRDRILDELRQSRRTIAERIGRETRFMAWPYGGTDTGLHELALQAGFSATVASTRLPVDSPPTMFKRVHFGEDYRGPFETTIQFWRFVHTVEAACEVGVRYRFSPLLRPLVGFVRRGGDGVQGRSRWTSR